MKCMNEKGLEAYQVKKNLKHLLKSLRTKIGVRLECFWERNREVSREINGNENRIAQRPYIGKPVNLDRCKYREVSSDLLRRCRGNARR